MNVSGYGLVAALCQVALVVVGAPLLTGLMRQVRARMEGRAGAGVGQPWRDLRKLLRKEPVSAVGTGPAFRVAPLLMVATSALAAALVPLAATHPVVRGGSDLIAVVALLALGTAALALAGLDTGTAFGGMGASREMTVAALVEPTILMAVMALSIPARSTDLSAIVSGAAGDPARLAAPASLLAAVALAVVTLAETGRLPVDNPATHLELTMVHEAMVLEYSGRGYALVKWGSWMKLMLLSAIFMNVFVIPWGLGDATTVVGGVLGTLAMLGKLVICGAVIVVIDSSFAKLRFFRIAEFLGVAFLLALVGITTSYVIGA